MRRFYLIAAAPLLILALLFASACSDSRADSPSQQSSTVSQKQTPPGLDAIFENLPSNYCRKARRHSVLTPSAMNGSGAMP